MNRPKRSLASSLSAPVAEEGHTSDDSTLSSNGNKKTNKPQPIPFLKRLRDMLLENEDAISFVPGRRRIMSNSGDGSTLMSGSSSSSSSSSSLLLGRIVVHDRLEVESHVLPRYFNHASFASLRRQLNYFQFVRLGKGRQRESTYINDRVIELDDLLKLKRKPTGTASGSGKDARDKVGGGGGVGHDADDEEEEEGGCETDIMYENGRKREQQASSRLANLNVAKRRVSEAVSEEDESDEIKATMLPPKKAKTGKRRRKNMASSSLPQHQRQQQEKVSMEAESTTATLLDSRARITEPSEDDHEPTSTQEEDVEKDQELLRGCRALLGLSGMEWNFQHQ